MKIDEAIFLWVAHASRVLVAASRRNNLFKRDQRAADFVASRKVRDGEDAIASMRDACATQASATLPRDRSRRFRSR